MVTVTAPSGDENPFMSATLERSTDEGALIDSESDARDENEPSSPTSRSSASGSLVDVVDVDVVVVVSSASVVEVVDGVASGAVVVVVVVDAVVVVDVDVVVVSSGSWAELTDGTAARSAASTAIATFRGTPPVSARPGVDSIRNVDHSRDAANGLVTTVHDEMSRTGQVRQRPGCA